MCVYFVCNKLAAGSGACRQCVHVFFLCGFLLRAQYQEGINFKGVTPSNLASWEIKQQLLPGKTGLSIFFQRNPSSVGDR